MTQQTSNDPKLCPPEPTAEEIVAAIEKFAATPRPIGSLHGFTVWVNPAMPLFNIEFRDPKTSEVLLRFSVDHPNIQGTKIERVARAALGLPDRTDTEAA